MGNHPSYDVRKDYARGKWYVSPWIYDSRKWAVYSPTGVCVSIHDSKREAVAELLEERETMQRLQESPNKERWPRTAAPTIECRKRDLVIRIADWHRINPDTGTGGYDVECYIGGIYDWNESKNFDTKAEAVRFAQAQIAKLL
jgi:hypothetical protein